MRKVLGLLFIFCAALCYSQTWTERDDENGVNYQWTMLTKEQYDRLLTQNQERYRYCGLTYTDYIEMPVALPVIDGERPEVDGQYYLYCKIIPDANLSRIDKNILLMVKSTLVYGNTNTGEMMLNFGDSLFMVDFYDGIYLGRDKGWLTSEVGWGKYQRIYNQYLRYVDGN